MPARAFVIARIPRNGNTMLASGTNQPHHSTAGGPPMVSPVAVLAARILDIHSASRTKLATANGKLRKDCGTLARERRRVLGVREPLLQSLDHRGSRDRAEECRSRRTHP